MIEEGEQATEGTIHITFPLGAVLNLLIIAAMFILLVRVHRQIIRLEAVIHRAELPEADYHPAFTEEEQLIRLRAAHQRELDEMESQGADTLDQLRATRYLPDLGSDDTGGSHLAGSPH